MTTLTKGKQSAKKATNSSPRELFLTAIKNKNKDQLHYLIELYLKINIPRVAISRNSTAPFDFICDFLFEEFTNALVLANRAGGKTMGFGVLDAIIAFVSPNTEVATVGAIQYQAKKAYTYFSTFSSRKPFADNIKTMNMGESKCHNGSMIQILTGTMSGMNSPHPQIAFIDEIDLMSWNILQQAFSMTQSSHGVKSRMVLTSTRKFAAGVMNRMMKEAKERDMALYRWNIWDVVEELPKDDPEMMQQIMDVFGDMLPDKIDQADGYYTWEDLIAKFKVLDPETWETEWLCERPGLEGVIYGSSYTDENNDIGEWIPPNDWIIYLWEDFGFAEGHPNVVLFVAAPPELDRLVVFDELYMVKYTEGQKWEATNNKLAEYGHKLPDKQHNLYGTIRGWVGDPHGLSEINERKLRGAPMMEKNPDSKMYIIVNGIPVVRKFLVSGRLMITDKCANLRLELLSYSFKKNIDGTFSKTTEKKKDHGPDALRYGLVAMGELIRKNWYSKMYDKPEKIVEFAQKREENREKTSKNPEKTITGGLMNMDF